MVGSQDSGCVSPPQGWQKRLTRRVRNRQIQNFIDADSRPTHVSESIASDVLCPRKPTSLWGCSGNVLRLLSSRDCTTHHGWTVGLCALPNGQLFESVEAAGSDISVAPTRYPGGLAFCFRCSGQVMVGARGFEPPTPSLPD